MLLGYDIINKIGYKKGLFTGCISVVGALLIIPSANANSFPAILGSFFVVPLDFHYNKPLHNPLLLHWVILLQVHTG